MEVEAGAGCHKPTTLSGVSQHKLVQQFCVVGESFERNYEGSTRVPAGLDSL
jgi:hypothetical protein